MDDEDNPYRRAVARVDRDPTPPSTFAAWPSQSSKSRNAPPRIKLLVADLGLRYRPSAAADLEAHATAIGLLTLDLADIPPDRLERAINAWVRRERWMPKASELIAICQEHQRAEIAGRSVDARSPAEQARAFAVERNAMLASKPETRKDIEWFVDESGAAKLRFKATEPLGVVPIHPADVPTRNASLAKINATFRYDDHGRRRDLTDTEEDRRLANGGPVFA